MSILESFALGKAVVGARIGGIPEMVINGETGWTFKSGDADELSALLSHLASLSGEALAQRGRAARHHVVTHFNRTGYLQATLDLYAELGVNP
jgi:glycosyltransferase involved in cell wall biosynthesis